jgi:hypothetical protein
MGQIAQRKGWEKEKLNKNIIHISIKYAGTEFITFKIGNFSVEGNKNLSLEK